MIGVFADPRHLRVGGRPLFLVYRPADLPDARRTVELLRNECVKGGLPEPYLIGLNAHKELDCRTLGFDGTLNYEPQFGVLGGALADGLKVYDYAMGRQLTMGRKRDYRGYPCIFVSWDNTARRGENAIVVVNSTPEAFEAGLRQIVQSVQDKPYDDRLVFINAWNEWAEGNYLEPDQRHGLKYLEAVQRVNCLEVPRSLRSIGENSHPEVNP